MLAVLCAVCSDYEERRCLLNWHKWLMSSSSQSSAVLPDGPAYLRPYTRYQPHGDSLPSLKMRRFSKITRLDARIIIRRCDRAPPLVMWIGPTFETHISSAWRSLLWSPLAVEGRHWWLCDGGNSRRRTKGPGGISQQVNLSCVSMEL